MVGKRQRCADKRQRWDRRAISNQHKQSVKLMVYALHLTLFYIGNACCERDLCVLDTFGFAPSPFKNILKIYFDNIKRMEPVNFNSIITHYIYILFKEMTRWNRSSIMVAHVNMHVNLSATFCPFFCTSTRCNAWTGTTGTMLQQLMKPLVVLWSWTIKHK